MLTAGHCGPGKYTIGNRVGGTVLGRTSSVYINDANRNDFQTITISGVGQGLVWTGGEDGSTSAPLEGLRVPAVGTDVTQDGGKTGEVPDNEVISNDAAILNLINPYNGQPYTVEHLVETKNPKGLKACQGGDSGGPTTQRTNSDYVTAIGTIVAVYTRRGSPTGSECASERITEELSQSNTSLVTRTAGDGVRSALTPVLVVADPSERSLILVVDDIKFGSEQPSRRR